MPSLQRSSARSAWSDIGVSLSSRALESGFRMSDDRKYRHRGYQDSGGESLDRYLARARFSVADALGIAMGVAGSDAALETADVALMTDELLKIPYTIRLSRATVLNIQANLAISTVMKAAFLVAAVAGVATLWMAVVADTGASIIVIANALRLLRAD